MEMGLRIARMEDEAVTWPAQALAARSEPQVLRLISLRGVMRLWQCDHLRDHTSTAHDSA
jgi:hypothetical protein